MLREKEAAWVREAQALRADLLQHQQRAASLLPDHLASLRAELAVRLRIHHANPSCAQRANEEALALQRQQLGVEAQQGLTARTARAGPEPTDCRCCATRTWRRCRA